MVEDKIDILLSENKKTLYQLADKTYQIGKLTTGQVLRIIQYIVKFSGKAKELKKQFETNEQSNNTQDILSIMGILDDEQVAEIEVILLNENDVEFIKANLDFEKLTELLAIVLENNDIKAILKNVQRLTVAVNKVKEI